MKTRCDVCFGPLTPNRDGSFHCGECTDQLTKELETFMDIWHKRMRTAVGLPPEVDLQ